MPKLRRLVSFRMAAGPRSMLHAAEAPVPPKQPTFGGLSLPGFVCSAIRLIAIAELM
jgi:hypothetical protein